MSFLDLPQINLSTIVVAIVVIFGLVYAIGGGVSYIIKALNPWKTLKAKVDECVVRLDAHDQKLKQDLERFGRMEENVEKIVRQNAESDQIQLEALYVLLEREKKESPTDVDVARISEKLRSRIFGPQPT